MFLCSLIRNPMAKCVQNRNSIRVSNFGSFWKRQDYCGLICNCNTFRKNLATSISEIHFRSRDFGFFWKFLAVSKNRPLETLEIVSFEHTLKENQHLRQMKQKNYFGLLFSLLFQVSLTELIQFWSWHTKTSSQMKKPRIEFGKKVYFRNKKSEFWKWILN